MLKIEVEMTRPGHRYEILFEPGLGANWRAEVAERVPAGSYLVLVDGNLARLRGYPASGTSDGVWHFLWVEPGEENKHLGQYRDLCEKASALPIDRRSVLVAVGGGVTGDIGGFVAATLFRGIRLVQIPTSLLAQVDSSVGGKNGVNTAAGKNLVGCFHQPELVLVDPAALDSLPPREYTAGLAEVVKTAILDGPDFLHQLQHSPDLMAATSHGFMSGVIARCCRFKTAVVVADETEKDRRQILNLGHTFAHALESLAGYDGRVVHGEAVAVGLVLACEFSSRLGMLPAQDTEDVRALLRNLGLPVTIRQLGENAANPPDWPRLLDGEGLVTALLGDKKCDGGKLTLILPSAIGDCRAEKGYSAGEVAAYMRGCIDY